MNTENPPTPRCSITGCTLAAVRACPWCGMALCRECWCREEVERARAEHIRRIALEARAALLRLPDAG